MQSSSTSIISPSGKESTGFKNATGAASKHMHTTRFITPICGAAMARPAPIFRR